MKKAIIIILLIIFTNEEDIVDDTKVIKNRVWDGYKKKILEHISMPTHLIKLDILRQQLSLNCPMI